MRIICLLTALFLVFLGCTPKSKNTEMYPKTYGNLKIAWRAPFKNDQLYGSRAPAIFGDKVVFSNYPAYGAETFLALNADNGETKYWEWQDYITSSAITTGGSNLPVVHGNTMCIDPGNGVIGINMETGQTKWKNHFSSYGGMQLLGSNTIIKQGQIGTSTAFIKLIDIETGADRIVFQIDTISTPYSSITAPKAYIQPTGDTILYFVFSELFQQPDFSVISNSKMYAYNITNKTILWQKDSNGAAFIVNSDKLFASTSDKIYCLNLLTGDIIWERPIPDKSGGYFHLYEDKLVITGQGSPTFVHAYNLSDGSPAWSIPFNGNTSEPMYYKGLMYFTCSSDGRLWAIKVSNGERIWHERCPDMEENTDSHWSFGVNVDPVRNKLYVASFTGAFCLELAN